MKRGLVGWMVVLALGIGLWVGCGDTNNTFGPSSGGGGGGGGGNTVMKVLTNGVVGYYNTVTLTATDGGVAMLAGTLGDTQTWAVPVPTSGGGSLGVWICVNSAVSGNMGPAKSACLGNGTTYQEPPTCVPLALWPTYGQMTTWTLEFDISVDGPLLQELNNISLNWGPDECVAGTAVVPGGVNSAVTFPNYQHVVASWSMDKPASCSPACSPVASSQFSLVFALNVLRTLNTTAGPGPRCESRRPS